RRLDLVAFSHAHADHIAGLEGVLDDLEVRVAIYPGVGRIFRRDINKGQTVEAVTAGETFVIGDLNVRVLGPPEDLVDSAREEAISGEGSGLNDASVVLRISQRDPLDSGDSCILFTGDIEEVGQEALITRYRRDIACDVLKAPHHGSPRIVEEFVRAADPEVVVVSVGRNDYGHPSRKALSMFERTGARVLRTDRLGDIVLVIDEQGRIET
ncbi:MAG: ComEC/Rec2 family competence protein, partial [Acidimicrobiia bacterium]